jgi:hypothetical protein
VLAFDAPRGVVGSIARLLRVGYARVLLPHSDAKSRESLTFFAWGDRNWFLND